MKLLVLIVASFAACSAKVIDPNAGYKEGDRYIFFPDGDGNPHLVDLQDEIDYDYLNSAAARNAENNEYWLYSRRNPENPQILRNWNADSVRSSYFNAGLSVVFIAHGWNSNRNSDINTLNVPAFLQRDDCNVIVLDWSELANRNYVTAKNGVVPVGRGLGDFVNFLHAYFGVPYDRMHLVGFSLGGHLVGHAGAVAHGEIGRITALDPAGPMMRSSDILRREHARYVEVMHTSSMLGYNSPLGHVDFFPNGGTSMPDCWVSTCSHSKAYAYMASTVKHNHLVGNRCESQRDAERDRCTGERLAMGNGDYRKAGNGIYRLNTGRHYPY